MVPGQSYRLSGTQINGLSQAVSYGDDAGMATNYPIVRLTSPVSGEVVYLRSHEFSTMGVATGSKVPDDLHSCSIDIPSELPLGDWKLAVIANGIASHPITVKIAMHCDGHHHHYVGKIQSLTYDRFGDFESFVLETADGAIHRFSSRERGIEELARRAWQERSRVQVSGSPHQRHTASLITFLA
jgi:hypothetical protein